MFMNLMSQFFGVFSIKVSIFVKFYQQFCLLEVVFSLGPTKRL